MAKFQFFRFSFSFVTRRRICCCIMVDYFLMIHDVVEFGFMKNSSAHCILIVLSIIA